MHRCVLICRDFLFGLSGMLLNFPATRGNIEGRIGRYVLATRSAMQTRLPNCMRWLNPLKDGFQCIYSRVRYTYRSSRQKWRLSHYQICKLLEGLPEELQKRLYFAPWRLCAQDIAGTNSLKFNELKDHVVEGTRTKANFIIANMLFTPMWFSPPWYRLRHRPHASITNFPLRIYRRIYCV